MAQHIKSVGEKDSPLPRLSTGASVDTVAPEGPCSNPQCNPPSYLIVHLTIGQHTTPHVRGESSENLATTGRKQKFTTTHNMRNAEFYNLYLAVTKNELELAGKPDKMVGAYEYGDS